MKLFKSNFSKIHFPFMVFATLNIAAGLALAFSAPYLNIITNIHYFSGILVIIAPFIAFLVISDKSQLLISVKGRLVISKNDRKYKRNLVMFSKTVAWVFLISLLVSMSGGIIIKTGIITNVLPNVNLLSLHRKLVFAMPFILGLHAFTMIFVMRPKSVKPSNYKIIQ